MLKVEIEIELAGRARAPVAELAGNILRDGGNTLNSVAEYLTRRCFSEFAWFKGGFYVAIHTRDKRGDAEARAILITETP